MTNNDLALEIFEHVLRLEAALKAREQIIARYAQHVGQRRLQVETQGIADQLLNGKTFRQRVAEFRTQSEGHTDPMQIIRSLHYEVLNRMPVSSDEEDS